jgi:hypothetical protein
MGSTEMDDDVTKCSDDASDEEPPFGPDGSEAPGASDGWRRPWPGTGRDRKRAHVKLVKTLAQELKRGAHLNPPRSVRCSPESLRRGPDGLTARARRFCELHAAQPSASEALRQAYWELGGCWTARPDTQADRYEKVPAVQKYLAVCRAQYEEACRVLSRFLPYGELPNLLVNYGGTRAMHFRSVAQFRQGVEDYFRERQERGMPLGTHDLAEYLGLSKASLVGLQRRGPEWKEVVDYFHTRILAWLERMAWVDAKYAWMSDKMMNRENVPEKPWEAQKMEKESMVADQLGQLMQEIHSDGGRRFLPIRVVELGQRQLGGPPVADDEPVLDRG